MPKCTRLLPMHQEDGPIKSAGFCGSLCRVGICFSSRAGGLPSAGPKKGSVRELISSKKLNSDYCWSNHYFPRSFLLVEGSDFTQRFCYS